MDNLPEDGSSSGTPVTDALESLMKRRPSSPTLPRVTEQEEDKDSSYEDEIVDLDINATGGDASDGETTKPNTPPHPSHSKHCSLTIYDGFPNFSDHTGPADTDGKTKL